MPEMIFTLRWPDGEEERCYSPSTVVAGHFTSGASYPMRDFLPLARIALMQASDRVQAVHGFPCSRAAAQLARIETRARAFTDPQAEVVCLSLTPQR